MVVETATNALSGLFVLVVSAIVLVVLGLLFFTFNLWIIKFAAIDILGLSAAGEWIVLSAAILSAASMIGSRKN